MKYHVQYRCEEKIKNPIDPKYPLCNNVVSLVVRTDVAPAICCKKHLELPVMKVIANVLIREEEENNENA